jgi:hypothetical protein
MNRPAGEVVSTSGVEQHEGEAVFAGEVEHVDQAARAAGSPCPAWPRPGSPLGRARAVRGTARTPAGPWAAWRLSRRRPRRRPRRHGRRPTSGRRPPGPRGRGRSRPARPWRRVGSRRPGLAGSGAGDEQDGPSTRPPARREACGRSPRWGWRPQQRWRPGAGVDAGAAGALTSTTRGPARPSRQGRQARATLRGEGQDSSSLQSSYQRECPGGAANTPGPDHRREADGHQQA